MATPRPSHLPKPLKSGVQCLHRLSARPLLQAQPDFDFMSTTTIKEPPKPNVIVMAEDDLDDRLLIKDALAESNWPADLRFVDNGKEMMDYLSRHGKYADPAESTRPTL